MKAAVLLEPGKLICRETPTPKCPPKGVLVEIQACGIYSADVKMVTNGHRALTYPRILGHEIAGAWQDIYELDTVKVSPDTEKPLVNNCGTGMDSFKTFNISTCSAIVAAAGGACLAKHGARAIVKKKPSGF